MFPWFLWKGIDSREYGIWVKELPQPSRAAERVEELHILGRPGSLHLKEGDNVHEGYKRECTITAPYNADFGTILTWLSGRSEVVFSNEPNRVYQASIPNEIRFSKEGNSLKSAIIPFFVHPHKGQYPPEGDIALSSSGTVFNPGTVDSRPIISVTFSETGTIAVNGEEMTFTAPAQSQLDIYEYERAKTHSTVGAVMSSVFQAGNVDLLNRPTVTEGDLYTAGWTDAEQGSSAMATVFTTSYKAGDGEDMATYSENIILHMTPIMAGGTIVSPSDLDDYVDDLLEETSISAILNADKTTNGGNGLILWIQEVDTGWDEGEIMMEMYDDALHLLQAAYYANDFSDMPLPSDIRKVQAHTVSEEGPIATSMTISVDCDAQIITYNGGMWVGKSAGDFPILKQGNNTITLTDATVSIKPQWRWF